MKKYVTIFLTFILSYFTSYLFSSDVTQEEFQIIEALKESEREEKNTKENQDKIDQISLDHAIALSLQEPIPSQINIPLQINRKRQQELDNQLIDQIVYLSQLSPDHNARPFSTTEAKENIDKIKKLILSGANINIKCYYNLTFRYYSVGSSILRGKPNNNNNNNNRMNTPLTLATACNYTELAKFLIEHGADVNIKSMGRGHTNFSPLQWAIYNFNPELTNSLITNGADLTVQDIVWKTPLIMYIENIDSLNSSIINIIDINIIKSILTKEKSNINAQSRDGSTALIYALKKKPYLNVDSIVELLINAGANPSIKNKAGFCPLNDPYVAKVWNSYKQANIFPILNDSNKLSRDVNKIILDYI